jgi:cohesin loading factor subunit SCC2
MVGHRHGEALLAGWYDLLKEKRIWRNDFLKALMRAFDYDLSRQQVVSVDEVVCIDNSA